MKTKNLTLAEALKTGLPFRQMEGALSLTRMWHCDSNVTVIARDAIEPIWEVKRTAREFSAYINEAGNLTTTPIGSVEKITLREVLDDE